MKILFVSTGYIPHVGGKSTHILDLKDGLLSMDIESEILSYNSINILIRQIFKIIIFPISILNNNIYQYYLEKIYDKLLEIKIASYLKKNSINYISAQDPQAACIVGKLANKNLIPVYLTMHSYFGLSHTVLKKSHNRLTKIYNERRTDNHLMAFKYINGLIAVDDRIQKHCVDKLIEYNDKTQCLLDSRQIYSIMNFTNIDKFKSLNYNEKIFYKKKAKLDIDKKIIICVRRLVDKNGVIEAVKAINILKHLNREDIVLYIVGDGPQRNEIKNYILKNNLTDQIKLIGEMVGEELLDLYYGADIAIVPSITLNGLQEATSISAIEAMSCGLPTIASNIGGLGQLIEHMKSGILIEEKNPIELAESIIMLCDNSHLYNQISNLGRKNIELNHSHIFAAQKYMSIFEAHHQQ